MRTWVKACEREIRIDGGLVRIARLEADKYQFVDDPEATLAGLRSSGSRIDLFTFLQRLPKDLEGPSRVDPIYPHPFEWDNLAVLPISTFDDWWTRQIENKTRNMARRAEKKGVVVREVSLDNELVNGIWEIYNESPVRQGKPFPHYGKSIETVRREEATFLDSSVFLGAYLGERLIGFIKLVFDPSCQQAGMMNVLSLIEERDKAPTNALVAQAVRSCAARQFSYLVYAGFAYGRKQSSSLSDFKEHNGFRRVDLPRYYVALTRIGRAAFRLGLHRPWTDHVPESLASRFRELREAWYARRLKSATEVR